MAKFIPYMGVSVPVRNDAHQKATQDLSSDAAKQVYNAITRIMKPS